MILLDTNTLIHYIRGLEPVVRRFQLTARHALRIPSIVAYELEYGALKTGSSRRRAITSDLLVGVAQISFDGVAAAETSRIRIDLEHRGNLIGPRT